MLKISPKQMSRSREQTSISFLRVGAAELAVIATPIAADAIPDNLTSAEATVLSAILLGKSNREIASERGTSIRTVANQVASLFRKLGVTSRAELALQQGRGGREERPPAGRPPL